MAKMHENKEVVLVTGSSGRIGTALIKKMYGDFTLAGFDREGPPHPPPEAECISVDVSSEESIEAGLRRVRLGYGEKIASVIHLAAYYNFKGGAKEKYDEITVRGTEMLLDSLRAFEVEQFIFSSTMLVHAPCRPGEKINEDWPLDPKWEYPKSKVTTEEIIRSKRGSLPAVLLRISGVYDDACHSIPIANQIQRIYERRITSRFYPGDLNRGQAFLHMDDLVEVIWLLARRRRQFPPELTLLLGEPDTLSYGELQKELGFLIHGEDWKTYPIPKPLAKLGAWLQDQVPFVPEPFIKPWMVNLADDHYALDISRVKKLLGWAPSRSLLKTLPLMVAALKADPQRWYRENRIF